MSGFIPSTNALIAILGGYYAVAADVTTSLAQQSTWNATVRAALDGYASLAGNNTLTGINHFTRDVGFTKDINCPPLKTALDGYQTQIDGISNVSLVAHNVFTAMNDFDAGITVGGNIANVVLDAALDGYQAQIDGISAVSLIADQTFTGINNFSRDVGFAKDINCPPLKTALDGYALDSLVDARFIENVTQSQNLRDAADGYGRNFVAQSTWNTTVLKDLDGYQSLIDSLENINTQQTIWNTTVRFSLDGYALDSLVDSNFVENVTQAQNLRNAADGYGRNFTAQTTWNTTVLKDLDGYALDSVEDARFIENVTQAQNLRNAADGYGRNFTAQTTWNTTVLKDLDGYALSSSSVSLSANNDFAGNNTFDGYVIFNKPIAFDQVSISSEYYCDGSATLILCNTTSASFSVFLPSAVNLDKKVITVKDVSGTAGAKPITVDVSVSSQTIDGDSTFVISGAYNAVWFVAASNNWFKI